MQFVYHVPGIKDAIVETIDPRDQRTAADLVNEYVHVSGSHYHLLYQSNVPISQCSVWYLYINRQDASMKFIREPVNPTTSLVELARYQQQSNYQVWYDIVGAQDEFTRTRDLELKRQCAQRQTLYQQPTQPTKKTQFTDDTLYHEPILLQPAKHVRNQTTSEQETRLRPKARRVRTNPMSLNNPSSFIHPPPEYEEYEIRNESVDIDEPIGQDTWSEEDEYESNNGSQPSVPQPINEVQQFLEADQEIHQPIKLNVRKTLGQNFR